MRLREPNSRNRFGKKVKSRGSLPCSDLFTSNENSKLHQFWILLVVSTHHLVPMLHEYLSRHECLAHSGVRILEIHIVPVDP